MRYLNERRSRLSWAVTATLSTALLLLAGCQKDAKAAGVGEGQEAEVRNALQGYFDNHPQCAPVLSTDSATGNLVALPDDPAARALLDAGVVERARPEIVKIKGEQVALYRPADQHRSSFAKGKWGLEDGWVLCFAKRSVNQVLIARTGAGARAEYRFRLVDAPKWMRDPAIVAGFPKVVATLSGQFTGEEPLPVENGKPDLTDLKPTFEHSLVTGGAAFLTP